MPWSNDQLNEIFIYDPLTGGLILSVDNTGFRYTVGDKHYEITTEGILGRLQPDTGQFVSLLPVDDSEGVRLELQAPPRDGVTPWEFVGRLLANLREDTPGVIEPYVLLSSPGVNLDDQAQIQLFGGSSDGSLESLAFFAVNEMTGLYSQQMSLGMLDSFTGTTSLNVTAEAVVESLDSEWFGEGPQASRAYDVTFSGTVSSTVAANRIGLRIYRCPTLGSLAGATVIADYGQITVATANVPQPFSVSVQLNGWGTDRYIALAGRRTAGAGTCNVTAIYRKLADISRAI